MPYLYFMFLQGIEKGSAVRPFDKLMALSKHKCVEGQAQAPSGVEGMQGLGLLVSNLEPGTWNLEL